MTLSLLCIESAHNLFSVSIKVKYNIYYKEFINKIYTIKDIIQIINNIMLANNVSYQDLDYIVYGDYPNSQTNVRSIISLVRCLSFIWKLPVLRVSSLLTISAEAFIKYKNENILIISTDNNGFLHYCISTYNNNKLISFNYRKIKNINSLKLDDTPSFIGIVNCSDEIKNFLKNFYFLNIKEKIIPKAFYTNFIIRELIFNKKIELQNKITSSYFSYYFYNKYKY